MAGLNETIISSIPISVPVDRDEQLRIAQAFSEMDELIASLEKMISKKKAIKQGIMQELLTGKCRLPGFNREWRTNYLTEIAEFPTTCIPLARIDSRDYVGTENMIPHVGGIRDNTIALESNFVREFRKNDILLSNIRPYLQKIWYADKNGGCSNDVLVIRSISDEVILSQYLFFLLSQQSFFDEIMSYAIGTKMPRGDKAVIKSYQVTYPCDIKEQERILQKDIPFLPKMMIRLFDFIINQHYNQCWNRLKCMRSHPREPQNNNPSKASGRNGITQ